MGAINYFTSDYITIGYNLNNIDYEDLFYNDIITDYYDQVNISLKQYSFYYWNVTIKPGYYEGFTIDIENNFPWCFDDYREKRAALKEVTQIKNFLLECINDFECGSVYPGWGTGYADYNGSIEDLKSAVEQMKQEVKNTPTYYTLPESEKITGF